MFCQDMISNDTQGCLRCLRLQACFERVSAQNRSILARFAVVFEFSGFESSSFGSITYSTVLHTQHTQHTQPTIGFCLEFIRRNNVRSTQLSRRLLERRSDGSMFFHKQRHSSLCLWSYVLKFIVCVLRPSKRTHRRADKRLPSKPT